MNTELAEKTLRKKFQKACFSGDSNIPKVNRSPVKRHFIKKVPKLRAYVSENFVIENLFGYDSLTNFIA